MSDTRIYGYRVELLLADAQGGTFVVPDALKFKSERGVLEVDSDKVAAAIDERELKRRKPLFREVKLTDAP